MKISNKILKSLYESYEVSGIAYVTTWDGDEGTIEMYPYEIDKITPENICQGANDAEFGVKAITGVQVVVDGQEYTYQGEEFKKYSKGKEKKGIQIPDVDLGEINNIEYFALYTENETYPVVKVNNKYLITRYKTNDFSGQWMLEGFIERNKYNLSWEITPDKALNITDWRFKNGNPRYTVIDYDHGSTRRWGGGGTSHYPYDFKPVDPSFFKRLIGDKDNVIISGQTYNIKSDSINESEQTPNNTSEYQVVIEKNNEITSTNSFPSEDEAIEYAKKQVNDAEPGSIISILDQTKSTIGRANKKDAGSVSYNGKSNTVSKMMSVFKESTQVGLWVNGKVYWEGDKSDITDELLLDVADQASEEDGKTYDYDEVDIKPLDESSFPEIDNDPDLDTDEIQSEVDYWTDVDKSRTEDVSGREPIGVYTVSNTWGIYVYDIKEGIDDMVLAGDSSDTTTAKWRYINYEDLIDEETGETIPFFYYNAIKVPMNEVMRTNIGR